MMLDRNTYVAHFAAAVFWMVGIGFVIVEMTSTNQTGDLGVLFAGVGILLNVRGFLFEVNRREQNAYTMGRDHEEGQRSVHSVD